MTTSYSLMQVQDLLDALASSAPLPGGGSAAALTGSIGVSLLLMVARMSKTRTGSEPDASGLAAAAARLSAIRQQLIALIDDDTAAYRAVIASYQLPKASGSEREHRREAIQRAMRSATDVPLQTMRACEQALRDARLIVASGNPNAVTDAAVGARLLLAALESAALNVDVNLPGVDDPDYGRASADERRLLQANARRLVDEVDAAIRQ